MGTQACDVIAGIDGAGVIVIAIAESHLMADGILEIFSDVGIIGDLVYPAWCRPIAGAGIQAAWLWPDYGCYKPVGNTSRIVRK